MREDDQFEGFNPECKGHTSFENCLVCNDPAFSRNDSSPEDDEAIESLVYAQDTGSRVGEIEIFPDNYYHFQADQ